MAGAGSTILSFDERKKIEYLLKQGYKTGGIAQILGRSHSCIKQEIRKNGCKSNYSSEVSQKAADFRQKARIDKVSKKFSEEQLAIIKDGVSQGLSQHKIADLVGVTPWCIRNYFKHNQIAYLPKNYTGMEQRLSALEDQIGIILEVLKEIKQKVK